jgi:hypothetical protein
MHPVVLAYINSKKHLKKRTGTGLCNDFKRFLTQDSMLIIIAAVLKTASNVNIRK